MPSSQQVRPLPGAPVLIFDGDCGICTRLAGFVSSAILPPAAGTVVPFQRLDLAPYGLDAQTCVEALQYVSRGGRVYAAQDAVARLLLGSRPWWRPVGAIIVIPGLNRLAGVVYRWVARNRHRLPGGTPACAMPPATAAGPPRSQVPPRTPDA
jgi:predicted DCC family thiol-disulfide oxidoreductase YuxK